MNDFFEAWHYLDDHRIFLDQYDRSHFQEYLYMAVVKVSPVTKSIEDNEEENTETNVWLEIGPHDDNHRIHDTDLDCGGETFEEAIVNLAKKVHRKYDKKLAR